MDQVCMFEEPMKEKISNDIIKAVQKGIIPGAIIIFDNNYKYKYVVRDLGIGNELKLEARLVSESGRTFENWLALSDRITVVGYKDYKNNIKQY